MRLLSSIWSGYSLTSSQLHFEANSSIYPEEAGVVGYLCHVTMRTLRSVGPVEDAGDFGQPASTQCRNLVLQLQAHLLIQHHFTSVTVRLL